MFFSLTIVNASDAVFSTEEASDAFSESNSGTAVMADYTSGDDVKEITKNSQIGASTKTGTAGNNIIYVANNGDSSINTTSMSNPTTFDNAFNILRENSTIYLEGTAEETIYDIESIISTADNTDVKNVIVTTSADNNIILRFSSDAYFLNSFHNINVSNVVFTNNGNLGSTMLRNSGFMNFNNCSFYYNGTDSASSLFYNANVSTLTNCKLYSVNSQVTYRTIYNEGTLTLNNCSIFNFNDTSREGVFYNKNVLTMNNCSVYSINTASSLGMFTNENELILNGCRIYNITTASKYGVIYSKDKLTLNNCRYMIMGVTCTVVQSIQSTEK